MTRFTQDLWEAMRRESREQLGDSITDADFDSHLPAWEDLDVRVRDAKVRIAKDELLKPLDRAGYEVRKKGTA